MIQAVVEWSRFAERLLMKRLLPDDALTRSDVVANCRMNRERQLAGGNSYAADLRLNPLAVLEERMAGRPHVAWLDLCCGTGKALLQAGRSFQDAGLQERVTIDGVDLVGMFDPIPPAVSCLSLHALPAQEWTAPVDYDLITCVHGLHYVGDKLGLIARAASWLTPDGLLLAHLDLVNVKLTSGRWLAGRLGKEFRRNGLIYDRRHHLLSCRGRRNMTFPVLYAGADDSAGRNFTGQPAVDSYYTPTAG